MLRHSVPHFPQNSGSITCWVPKLNAALCQSEENISYPRVKTKLTTRHVYSHISHLSAATGLKKVTKLTYNSYLKWHCPTNVQSQHFLKGKRAQYAISAVQLTVPTDRIVAEPLYFIHYSHYAMHHHVNIWTRFHWIVTWNALFFLKTYSHTEVYWRFSYRREGRSIKVAYFLFRNSIVIFIWRGIARLNYTNIYNILLH